MPEPYQEPPPECRRKQAYPSKSFATKVARRNQHEAGKLHVYRCTFPRHVRGALLASHWHVGHPRRRAA